MRLRSALRIAEAHATHVDVEVTQHLFAWAHYLPLAAFAFDQLFRGKLDVLK